MTDQTAKDKTAADKLKIFISYARRDCSAFAADLLVGLDMLGFAPFLDRHDIAAGEDWEARLAGLIQAADTIVYVISPESMTSERCGWEVDKALALAKRIIPVVAIAVPDANVPPKLKQLNYIFFNEPHTMARALDQLAKALRTDLDWIREHTRLGELAVRWLQRSRADALLLRGAELEAAASWQQRWKAGAPEITDAHRAFIAASTEAETRRANTERQQLDDMAKAQAAQASALADREATLKTLSRRTVAGLAAAGVLTTAAAGLAYWGVDAESRFRDQRDRAADAEKRSVAETIRKEAAREDIEGQLIAYAAAVGGVAMDGKPGENSPFTKAVLRSLEDPNVPVYAALTRAAKLVFEETDRQQRPYLATDMGGDIYLKQQPANRRRKALVFSIDNIAAFSGSLANAELDAKAWEAMLKAAGFDVQRLINPKKAQVEEALGRLTFEPIRKQGSNSHPLFRRVALVPRDPAPGNTLAAVYFSGFGASIAGENYIGLSDTTGSKGPDIAASAVSVMEIQAILSRSAAASILILDTDFQRVGDDKPNSR